MLRSLSSSRVRLYESVRTAHLERAHELTPAAIVYRVRRYDFDEEIARGLELAQAGPLGAALLLRRSRISALEINEPLMLSSLPMSALAVFAVRFARRRPPRIVTYAIGNADPFPTPGASFKRRVRRRIEAALSRYVWKRLDAVAYGTQGARDVYRDVLPARPGLRERLIPALPARDPDAATAARSGVVFLGAFVARKGLPLLLRAWPLVVAERPDATLAVMGKGVLADDVRAAADADASITVIEDPSRAAIREILRGRLVLALPSQPSPTWREQVGLPIVEALEQGCAIVTTTETGLAGWLTENGHGVIPADAGAEALAAAILDQLGRGDRSADILDSLPDTDGRLAADVWLFGDDPTAPER